MVEVNTSLTLLVVLMFYKLTTHGSAVDIKKKNGTAALSLTSAPQPVFQFSLAPSDCLLYILPFT